MAHVSHPRRNLQISWEEMEVLQYVQEAESEKHQFSIYFNPEIALCIAI